MNSPRDASRAPCEPEKRGWRRVYPGVLAVAALLILTESFYVRPALLTGRAILAGTDYYQMHIRRLRFAREALLAPRHMLPAWYPREVMGAPFAANLQSFPWIPTRLVLLLFDPAVAYAVGIALAAGLAALFTFLYCRRTGLGHIPSVAAGFTFACAGFLATRVLAGHLPLIEAYPSLPLLLWLMERGEQRHNLAWLAVASACVVVAGHPQLSAYAMASALLYAVATRRFRAAAAMVLGAGLTLIAWWPMLLLIGRSTRVLHLAPPENDISVPYRRLLALVNPGIDGWPGSVTLPGAHKFSGYPNDAYFWDTASYIGILPLVTIAVLAIRCAMQRRTPELRWTFLAGLSLAAFICALPFATPLLHALPGTLLRSPARLMYICTFGAAISTGVFIDWLGHLRWGKFAVLVLLTAHIVDLGRFCTLFIHVDPRDESPALFHAIIDREAGDARIAEARFADLHTNEDRHDDAGGFDSIFLANSYRFMIEAAGLPRDTNQQIIDASIFPGKALRMMGVKFVITTERRPDLQLQAEKDGVNLYRIADAWPRASLANGIVEYQRPSSDEVLLHTRSGEAGLVQILESFDPGWTATVDGAPAAVRPRKDMGMAVPVGAGNHAVRLVYRTPGRAVGAVLSVISLACLIVLIALA